MSPKLSVIIPCYNCEKTLRAAVESCYTQGFDETNFEIVLVNDASTDSTSLIMETLEQEHSNINIYFHERNQGGGATRNTATKYAKAEIIFCLDSDDILPPNTLGLMYAHMTKKNCDGVGIHTSIKFIGNDTNNVDAVHKFSRVNERITLYDLLQKDGLCSLYSTFMFTKDAFHKAGEYPTEHGFDTQGFAWRFLTANLYAETCPDASYLHRVQFHESYYLREYNGGKVNFNWQAVLSEHLPLFTENTQMFIKQFPCQDFTRNLWDEFIKRSDIFRENYLDLVSAGYVRTTSPISTTKAIKRKSVLGILMLIKKHLLPTKKTSD